MAEGVATPEAPPRPGFPRALALVAVAALGLWLWVTVPLALGIRTLYFRDVFTTHVPWKAFGAAELRHGRIPAFNPTWALGQPFRGEALSQRLRQVGHLRRIEHAAPVDPAKHLAGAEAALARLLEALSPFLRQASHGMQRGRVATSRYGRIERELRLGRRRFGLDGLGHRPFSLASRQ